MIKKTLKTISFFLFLLVAIFFSLSSASVQAQMANLSGVEVGNSSGNTGGNLLDQAFSKLGVDKDELSYSIQSANVSRRKKQQPQVGLSFGPENPVSGEKVTVTATPAYFSNATENIYFTWYLRVNGCPEEKTSNPSESIKKKCDTDGNGSIDINDYKVKATQILAGNDFEWDQANYSSGGGEKKYKAIWGGNDQKEKGSSTGDHCYVHDVDLGDEYEIVCDEHLFPHAYENGTSHEIGKGSFSLSDEKFFHTDPDDPDTADTGNGDEANAVGLGLNSFSWNYTEGDQVGVVAEGISMEPTQYADSTFKIMWAFANNKCELGSSDADYPKTSTEIGDPVSVGTGDTCPNGTDVMKEVTTTLTESLISQTANNAIIRTEAYKTDIIDSNCDGTYDETPGSAYDQSTTCPNGPDYNSQCLGIACYGDGLDKNTNLGTDLSLSKVKNVSDLNDCLYDNFVNPVEGGGAKTKMEVSLTYTPNLPMNDPGSGSSYNENGDGTQLTVQSSITNVDNPEYLKYTWQIYESNEPNPDSWDSISKSRLPSDLVTSGISLSSLKLKLNIPDLKKYLKVKITASENISGTSEVRTGHAEAVILVSKITQRIKAYSTTVSNSLEISLDSDEMCLTDEKPDAICLVPKDKIVGLSVDKSTLTDFLWTVNGKAIAVVGSSKESGPESYFPILEDNGYRYNVELTATNSIGEKINLFKTFEVADPEASIVSADKYVCTPNLLGYYIDTDGKYWPDYSKTNFSALSETPIKLEAQFSGISPSSEDYSWYVDGNEITEDTADSYGYSLNSTGILTLSEKITGEAYDVGVGLLYTPDNNTKKALSEYWNVPMNKFYEKKIGTTIQISFVESISSAESAGKNTPKKILASMYLAAPAYIAFLLRIVLTAFSMLIFSKIILSFFPNLNKNEC